MVILYWWAHGKSCRSSRIGGLSVLVNVLTHLVAYRNVVYNISLSTLKENRVSETVMRARFLIDEWSCRWLARTAHLYSFG